MSKPVDGPWEAAILEALEDVSGGVHVRWYVRTNHGRGLVEATICEVPDWPSHVAEKTAFLLAAAPDLFASLEALVNFNEADPDLYEGDEDGTLGRIMFAANEALGKAKEDDRGRPD